MKKKYFLVYTLGILFSADVLAQKHHQDYKLIWRDEFNRDGRPDKSNWDYEKGFVRNEEAHWYQEDNAYCKDGFLIIEARQEKRANPNFKSYDHTNWRFSRDSIRYTSSCLITKDKHAWKFGRFEMRAKIPVASGMWPAFWTLGIKGNWPANGEIDIMEYYRGKILANAAWQSDTTERPSWDTVSCNLSNFEKPNSEDKFHIWRMDWDLNYIKLFLDDQLLNTIDLASTINGGDSNINPFHQPHYILINLAVGGSQGEDPTHTNFPQQFVIDYVRVYQLSD